MPPAIDSLNLLPLCFVSPAVEPESGDDDLAFPWLEIAEESSEQFLQGANLLG